MLNIKNTFFAILVILSTFNLSLSADNGVGELGSKMESFQVRVTSLDLIKPDDSLENVYSGSSFVGTSGEGSSSIVGTLSGSFPPTGNYKGLMLTADAFKIQLNIVIDGISYYTKEQTIEQGDIWPMSTNISEYGALTLTTSMEIPTIFSAPLVVTDGEPVNLGWVLQRGDEIQYDYSAIPINENITWAQQVDLVRAFTPDKPTKYVQLDLKTTLGEANTLTLLMDKNGNLLGGFSHRHQQSAMNGSFMSMGTLATLNSGKTGTFTLTFPNSNGGNNEDIIVEGQYDCNLQQYEISNVTPTIPDLNTSIMAGLICKP